MDVRGYVSSARDVIGWKNGGWIFHWYSRKSMSGVFQLDLHQPIIMICKTRKAEDKKNLQDELILLD